MFILHCETLMLFSKNLSHNLSCWSDMFCSVLFIHLLSHQAESELQRATMDATRTTRQLEETIDEFEKQKIRDIKVCCSELSIHLKLRTTISKAHMSVGAVGDSEVKPDSDNLDSLF